MIQNVGHKIILPLLCICLIAGCKNERVRAHEDGSSLPVSGGTLEIVGRADVDHLATTSGYVTSTQWLFRTFARQLLAYRAASLAAVTCRVEVPTMGDFPFAHLA
jgi:hypothetical protein